MKRILLLIPLLFSLIPITGVSGIEWKIPDHNIQDIRELQEISFELDGISFILKTPFFPDQTIITPDPSDPLQMINIVQRDPIYQSLTINAIPYGSGNSAEGISYASSGQAYAYREALIEYRRNQGGSTQKGPVATFFNQEVTGIMSSVFINIDVFGPKPAKIIEWIFEAGHRLWIVRVTQEEQLIEHLTQDLPGSTPKLEELLLGISLTSKNLDIPSTSIGSKNLTLPPSLQPELTTEPDLPFPHWWDGECDKYTYFAQTGDWSYPLGGEYRGVKACGPRPFEPDVETAIAQFNPGWWGVYEWECVELSMRFLYLAYGVQTYQANGNQVVTNYSGDQLMKINDGTPGFAPQPNDVLSLGPETPVGHTSVVISSNVGNDGNGSITVLEENSSASGLWNYTVSNWSIQSGYTVIGWLHDPENQDFTPPQGDILDPLGKETVQSNILHLEGWATDDDSGLSSAQFIANYEGAWHDIGPSFNTPFFSYDWDWCSDQVRNGPINLALRLIDNQGNQTQDFPGLRGLIKDFECPSTPSCTPSSDQIALFEEIGYGGDCQIFNIGSYPDTSSFSSLDNNTESILVGDNVMATLYTDSNFQDRRDTIMSDDPNLSDNLIGTDTLSSILVTSKNTSPSTPTHQFPEYNSSILDNQSFNLFWQDEGGAAQTRVTIDGPSISKTSEWGRDFNWSLGSLSPGYYSWQIQARNGYGDSDWSPLFFFLVNDDGIPLPESTTAPFLDNLEGNTSSWRTTGLWHLTNINSHSSSHSWYYGQEPDNNYDNGFPNSGSLTSPPINIPDNPDPYVLTFWSLYETETTFSKWDQRRVQISIDEGEFQDIYQFQDDPKGYWLENRIDLSPFYTPETHHELQIRFDFSTLDDINNNHLGWLVDDIQIQAEPPEPCTDSNEPNNTATQAVTLAYGDEISGSICPGGDSDYYTFTGETGDQIVVDIDSFSLGSSLDSIILLMDSDGSSILAQHDDEVYGVQKDPHLGYRLPYDGVYYLKLHAWNTPMGTGDYTLSLDIDPYPPLIQDFSPTTGTFLPSGEIDITVNTSDDVSGIQGVRFLGYADGWSEISQDSDGSDGWATTFNTSALQEGDEIAFYAQVTDWSGQFSGVVAWDLTLDFSYPNTTAPALPDPNPTTAVHLTWDSTDNISGIRSYHIRHKKNSEDWITQYLDGDINTWWFIGEAGNLYTFRIRAIDEAGNIEPYLEGAEISTTIPDITVICSEFDPWDSSSTVNDNDFSNATPLPPVTQIHNFCNPEAANRLNDFDWFQLQQLEGEFYKVQVTPLHPSSGAIMRLFAADGMTLISESLPLDFGMPSTLEWIANQDQEVYIQISHLNGAVAGDVVAYQVEYAVEDNTRIYFPLIQK